MILTCPEGVCVAITVDQNKSGIIDFNEWSSVGYF